MQEYRLPYGKGEVKFTLPQDSNVSVMLPGEVAATDDPHAVVCGAFDSPIGNRMLAKPDQNQSVAIAINDKTRPVPNDLLLPPLLAQLSALGFTRESITFVIATGAHAPMTADEFHSILPQQILSDYRVISHDCDDEANLIHLGQTDRGTPVWVNRRFYESSVRIVVGNIEPHQFMGFSGGVKTAAIGLAGRATINHNHALMMDPYAQLGHFEDNPARQDVEAIGALMGIEFALNAVLNREKRIVHVLFGAPDAVMAAGVPLVRALYEIPVTTPFDFMIVSPGGYPKDLNLYQAQKALGHASLVTRAGGAIIVIAACSEGTGSQKYEDWITQPDLDSHEAVFARFKEEGFRVGPHKAYQISRDSAGRRVYFLSEMAPDFCRKLLLTPVLNLQQTINEVVAGLPPGARIGVMPLANATVPLLTGAPA